MFSEPTGWNVVASFDFTSGGVRLGPSGASGGQTLGKPQAFFQFGHSPSEAGEAECAGSALMYLKYWGSQPWNTAGG